MKCVGNQKVIQRYSVKNALKIIFESIMAPKRPKNADFQQIAKNA